MNQIQELCAMLDERGVEYTQMTTVDGILFNVVTRDGRYFILVRDNGTGIKMWSRNLTPEQAIAATLGPGTCKFNVVIDQDPSMRHRGNICKCDKCGYTCARGFIEDEHFKCCPGCGRRIEVSE